ncbi:MAG: helix-turn-helix transcriptional regulator [Lachnospiraceae bacterium]|nr:helix-turn-helix transcriptional regulator [Lachnospiraceae bacterium]
MKFNQKLQETRKTANLTQKRLAQKLEISERAYQHYEAGTREPNIETLIKLSSILNVSLDDLLCKEDFLQSHEVFSDEY